MTEQTSDQPTTKVRPFLKWVGGKTQLIKQIRPYLPATFNAYHEPFVGGGAMFFALYRDGRISAATLSDLNQELIDTYTAIRDDVDSVLNTLEQYIYEEEAYYSVRAQDPQPMTLVERAARMIYLNKTGFNGLYRVNRKGKFNVPFGRYKNPTFRDPANLYAVSRALENVQLLNTPFSTVLGRVAKGDLVYFDPPYVPLSATANFTGYQANGFSYENQVQLRDVALQLKERGVHVILSNSSADLVKELYDNHFTLHEVKARRTVNSNPQKRGKLSELLITSA